MNIRTVLRITGIASAFLMILSATATPALQQQKFIDSLTQKYHLSTAKIKTILKRAKYLPEVIRKITTPYEAQPFDVYIHHFLTQQRINQGVKFWSKHHHTLELAQKKYGVDPSIIIAILGVETRYGQNKGKYPVLDALYTLSFFYPPRANFFANELAQYLVMCHNQHLSPYDITGSYAGAFGMPQFMPSSYRAYGVDFSGNHHIDLMKDTDDVIMSVANYLAKAGWQRQATIASPIHDVNPHTLTPYLSANATPRFSIAELTQHGIYSGSAAVSKQQMACVIALQGAKTEKYWITFTNFRSIMKYNPSLNYAMTVYQLSEAIRKKHDQQLS